MKFEDQGIIIEVRSHSEKSAIVKVFSQQNGIYLGYVKNIISKKNKLIFQAGNLISFQWHSRIEDKLGSFTYCDLLKSYMSRIIFDKVRFYSLNTIMQIINDNFHERDPMPQLYSKFFDYCELLTGANIVDEKVFLNHIIVEFEILNELGYGIDLSSCAVTSSDKDLAYVSPKSARAVSREVGEPYKEKILKLPKFLLAYAQGSMSHDLTKMPDSINLSESNEGVQLTGYFLEKYGLIAKDKFYFRNNLLAKIKRYSASGA